MQQSFIIALAKQAGVKRKGGKIKRRKKNRGEMAPRSTEALIRVMRDTAVKKVKILRQKCLEPHIILPAPSSTTALTSVIHTLLHLFPQPPNLPFHPSCSLAQLPSNTTHSISFCVAGMRWLCTLLFRQTHLMSSICLV